MARCLPVGHLLAHFVVTVKIDSNKSSSLPSLETKIIWVQHHALQESDTTLDELINQCPHINAYILDRTVKILLMNENSLRNNSTAYPLCPTQEVWWYRQTFSSNLFRGKEREKGKSCARSAFVSTTFKIKKRRANVINNVSILLTVKSPGSPEIKSITSSTEFELLNQESDKRQYKDQGQTLFCWLQQEKEYKNYPVFPWLYLEIWSRLCPWNLSRNKNKRPSVLLSIDVDNTK